MKIFKNLSIITLSLLLILTMCSCSCKGDDDSDSKQNNNGSSYNAGEFSKDQVKADKALLVENGYDAKAYYASSTNLVYAESQIGAKEGELQAYIYATGNGKGVYIYYLTNAKAAQACYDSQTEGAKSAYKVKGNRLFQTDTTGLFD